MPRTRLRLGKETSYIEEMAVYNVPNGEDEEEEVKILSAEAALDLTYSLKGGDGD